MNNWNVDEMTKTLAVEMTARTGELWRAIITENHNHIESSSACLSLANHWQTHRLTIHATAPAGIREPRTGETITADPGRKAEAIAQDICSRILLHAREHLAQAIEYDRKQRQKEAAQNLRQNLLKRYTPKEYNNQFTDGHHLWTRLTYENKVTIEITLPLPEALKLLKMIKERNPHK